MAIVLAADTTVVIRGEALAKPADAAAIHQLVVECPPLDLNSLRNALARWLPPVV